MGVKQGTSTSYSKPFSDTYHGWEDVIEKVSYDSAIIASEDIFRGSELLKRIVGDGMIRLKGTNVQTGIETEVVKFKNTFDKGFERFGINKMELITDPAELTDFSIQYGDAINPKSGRDLVFGNINKFTIGGAITYTDDDKIEIGSYKSKMADWIIDSHSQIADNMRLHLFKQILSGTPKDSSGQSGTVTRYTDGVARDGAVGLDTIISATADYAGVKVADWRYWKGQSYDLTSGSTFFGKYLGTDLDSIADWQTVVASGASINKGYDFINMIRRTLPKTRGSKYIVLVHPYFYDFVWLPMVELMKTSQYNVNKSDKNILNYNDENAMNMGEFEIVKETAQIGNAYLMPLNKIYIIDINDLVIGACKDNNMKWSPWEKAQQMHGSWFRMFDCSLIFYSKRRYGHGVVTLPVALVNEMSAIVGSPVAAS